LSDAATTEESKDPGVPDLSDHSIRITQQVFSDKLLISKSSQGQVKTVSRDLSDKKFHLGEIDMA
jgi:hypothetical protein